MPGAKPASSARRVVSVVGTRRCTRYGQDLIHSFVHRLKELCPEMLVVSGLAYGVDIWAHRECLANEMPTVGVLAHGLDDLYPRAHRETANRMVAEGGALLTEFMTHTTADKINFVRRNRIVAGMSDAVVLVESADKGGGLITCGIARDYARDVFAFPGAVGAPYSEGCNHLIRDNGAGLITCADELVEAMGWQTDQKLTEAKRKGIERQLFPNLSPEEQRVVDELRKCNDLQIERSLRPSECRCGTAYCPAFLVGDERGGARLRRWFLSSCGRLRRGLRRGGKARNERKSIGDSWWNGFLCLSLHHPKPKLW